MTRNRTQAIGIATAPHLLLGGTSKEYSASTFLRFPPDPAVRSTTTVSIAGSGLWRSAINLKPPARCVLYSVTGWNLGTGDDREDGGK
eukprot:1966229-Rhodomonas_salina.2